VDRASERVAAAVIRAWIESEGKGIVKIRITTKADLEGRRETIGVASTIEEACDIVREWLEEFVWAQSGGTSNGGRAS
jgi:hypothetical protein